MKSEDVEVGEEADHVEEGDVRPRERALPSYIKKEKPVIRLELIGRFKKVTNMKQTRGGEGRWYIFLDRVFH